MYSPGTEAVAGDYPGGIAFPTSCDEQGRLCVKLVEAGPGMVGPLFRLSSVGIMEAEFDTSGTLMNRYSIDNFAPDGARQSSVALERSPTPFFPAQLAMFRSGEILVSGLQYHPGYKASTAIFDPNGPSSNY